MRFPTEGTRVPEDKDRPRGLQLPRLLFLSPEEREKSPFWQILRSIDASLARIRACLPQSTPERLERLRAMQPRLPAHVLGLTQRWRNWWEAQAEAARASEPLP